MKVKRILIFLILASLLTGCSNNKAEQDIEVNKKPVKTMDVDEEVFTSELLYIGIVTPEEIKKLSFKTSGKIQSIKVSEGEKVKKGQTLATIDTKDIAYSINAAKATKAGAQAQYEKALNGATEEDINIAMTNASKAEKAYSFAKDNYEKAEKLYEAGGLSKQEKDNAKLELDIREEEYKAAKTILTQVEKGAREEDIKYLQAQIDQADTDLSHKKSVAGDAVMLSDIDGYIMDILARKGEIIGSGYPLIVLGSARNIVRFGLAPDDAAHINIGDEIRIEVQGLFYDGKITSIDQIMDEETRTYNVRGEVEDSALPSGTIAKVYIPLGEYKGIKIPLTSVMRGSYDYAYIVVDGQAKKKQVELGAIEGEKVEVLGLSKGDKLIIEGMKKLNDGDFVEVIK